MEGRKEESTESVGNASIPPRGRRKGRGVPVRGQLWLHVAGTGGREPLDCRMDMERVVTAPWLAWGSGTCRRVGRWQLPRRRLGEPANETRDVN